MFNAFTTALSCRIKEYSPPRWESPFNTGIVYFHNRGSFTPSTRTTNVEHLFRLSREMVTGSIPMMWLVFFFRYIHCSYLFLYWYTLRYCSYSFKLIKYWIIILVLTKFSWNNSDSYVLQFNIIILHLC